MKKLKFATILSSLGIIGIAPIITSCNNNPQPVPPQPVAIYKVHFDLKGGYGEIEDLEVSEGEKITKPEEQPIKLGYDFAD